MQRNLLRKLSNTFGKSKSLVFVEPNRELSRTETTKLDEFARKHNVTVKLPVVCSTLSKKEEDPTLTGETIVVLATESFIFADHDFHNPYFGHFFELEKVSSTEEHVSSPNQPIFP